MTRQEQFIARIAPLAQKSQREFGVPASVTIAQAILESQWGRHAPGNNFFGIMKGAANVPFIAVKEGSTAKMVNLRSYATAEECFADRGKILSSEARYCSLMADASDPIVFATNIGPCGWNTVDRDYGAKLVKLMKSYKLSRFDSGPDEEADPQEQGQQSAESGDRPGYCS